MIDPGVLISAQLSPNGNPAELLRMWLAGAFELIVSDHLLGEIGDVFERPKFQPYLSTAEAEAFVALLRDRAIVEDDPAFTGGLTPDPDDDDLVALARSSSADALVSGGRDLSGLADPRPPVLSPAGLIALLSVRDERNDRPGGW